MAKLAKGLTRAAGGVPAAAIITACVINANPNATADTGRTEQVAAETDAFTAPAPPHDAASHGRTKTASHQDRSHQKPAKGRPAQARPASDLRTGPNTAAPEAPEATAMANPAAGFGQPVADPATQAPATPALQVGAGTSAPPASPAAAPAAAPATATDPAPVSAPTGPTITPTAGPTTGPAHRTRPPRRETPVRTAPDHPAPHRAPLTTRPGTAKTRPATASSAHPADHTTARTTPDAAGTSGTASKSLYVPTEDDVKKMFGRKVVAFARAQLGKPYVYGAAGPHAYDCSGLVQAAYKSAGFHVPRTSDAQYWYGKRVHAGKERPGDLVYFDYRPGHTGPGHVGIVMDPAKGLMIVAPHTGDHVKIQSYKRYPGGPVGFTRPLDRKDMKISAFH